MDTLADHSFFGSFTGCTFGQRLPEAAVLTPGTCGMGEDGAPRYCRVRVV